MRLRFRPRGSRLWPENFTPQSPAKIVEMYRDGFCGAWRDEESRAELWDAIQLSGGHRYGDDTAREAKIEDTGAGRLSLSYLAAAVLFPGCYPGAAQERGDCVSHSAAGACLVTIANEIYRGLKDEHTQNIEGVPDLSVDAIKQAPISSEWVYWWRGYDSDGWDCAEAASMVLKHGTMLRQNYPELGIDLSRYSGSLAGKYGRRSPPPEMDNVGKQHLIRSATEANSLESTRDLICQGFGISDCGSEGYSDKRDANGFSKRSGGWPHAMKTIGFDDRPEIIKLYGEPGVLICNNWGRWNSGSRDIYDSAKYVPPSLKMDWIKKDLVNATTGNLMIPEGSFWVRWSDQKNRYRVALSSANGWKAKEDSFLVV